MPVPPVGVRFRILSAKIKSMLGGKIDPASALSYYNSLLPYGVSNTSDYSYYDDTWFTIESSEEPGYCRIYNYTTKRYIYGSEERDEVGLTRAKGYKDQLWQFSFNDDNEFQLKNYRGGKLFLRDHAQPNLGLTPSNTYNYRDQFFRFYFEEFHVKGVSFSLNDIRNLSKTPKQLLKQTITNHSSVEQEQKFTVTYHQTKQHRWAYTGGFRITAEMSVTFKAGIPFFAETETNVKLGAETSHTWTNESTTTESKEMKFEFPVKVPPEKSLSVSALITEETVDVPYVMTFSFKGSNIKTTSSGKWLGSQCVSVFNEIMEI